MPIEHCLFFAILPPPDARATIAAWRDAYRPSGAIVTNARLHMTLAITADFAELPTQLVDRLLLRATDITSGPVGIVLDHLHANGETIALRPSKAQPALSALQRELVAIVAATGVARSARRPSPHVTLGYDRKTADGRRIPPIGWLASEIVLIHSHVGATRHVRLGTFPLVERQAAFALS